MAIMSLTRSSLLPLLHMSLFIPQKPSNMLYRLLVATLIGMSASVTSAAPAVLDAGDALEARMAKLEATVNKLEFMEKVKELAPTLQYEQFVKKQRGQAAGGSAGWG